MRVIDCLLKTVPDAAAFNPEVQVAPACILWPEGKYSNIVIAQ